MQKSTDCGESSHERYVYTTASASMALGSLWKRKQKDYTDRIPKTLGIFEIK